MKTITENELKTVLEKHKKWMNGEEDGERAVLVGYDLSGSDLIGSNLSGSDLRGRKTYNACLPLWCGGLTFCADRLFVAQIAYHLCSIVCEDEDVQTIQKSLYKFANEFARSRKDLIDKQYPEDDRSG